MWRDEAPEGKLDLLLSLDFRMTSTTIFSDVVLPAATWYEKHDLNTTDMHPFIHSFNPAIAPPWQTRTDWDAFQTIAQAFSRLAETHLGVRKDVVAVPLLHDTADEMANPHGVVADWKAGDCEPVPGRTMPKLVVVERDYPAVAAKMSRARPADGHARRHHQGRHLRRSSRRSTTCGARTARCAAAPPTGGRRWPGTSTPARRSSRCPAPPTGTWRRRASAPSSSAPGSRLADLAAEHEGKQITFADTQARPGAGHHLPGVVRLGDRRAPLLAVHHQRGAAQAVAHADRPPALLPRPRLDDRARRGAAGVPAAAEHDARCSASRAIGETGELGLTVRYLTPHNKWSIHSEYQDNLFMLTLSRGGQAIWMSQEDAAKIGVHDNDWIEAVNRNGVVVARAIVSHRMPEGTVYMYHAQDRLIDVPRSRDVEASAAASTTR